MSLTIQQKQNIWIPIGKGIIRLTQTERADIEKHLRTMSVLRINSVFTTSLHFLFDLTYVS